MEVQAALEPEVEAAPQLRGMLKVSYESLAEILTAQGDEEATVEAWRKVHALESELEKWKGRRDRRESNRQPRNADPRRP